MQTRIVTLQYSEEIKGFPEDQLQKAMEGRRVLHISNHFFVHGNVPLLSFVLLLQESPDCEINPAGTEAGGSSVDPVADLREDEKKVFEALRAWRSEVARKAEKPAYAIAKNTQLVRIVKAMPRTLGELRLNAKLSDEFCTLNGEQVLSVIATAIGEQEAKASDGKHWWNIGG